MSALTLSIILLAVIFGGALLGMLVGAVLPDQHLSAETKDVVRLGIGVIATLSALVLSLLIASAKTWFDTHATQIGQMTADIIGLDVLLEHYGPEARGLREHIRRALPAAVDQIWRENMSSAEQAAPFKPFDNATIIDAIMKLAPHSDAQRAVRDQAIQVTIELGRIHTQQFAQRGDPVPTPFLVVLVFWLAIIFASFGLFAPYNRITVGTLFLCALSASGAIFLILEMYHPFEGMMAISSAPLRSALAPLDVSTGGQ